MPSLTTRPETPADMPFLLEVYAGARQEELNVAGWPEATRKAFVEMQFKAQQQGYQTAFPLAERVIILEDDKPVGRMVVDRAEGEIRLVDIAVLPARRGRGLGKMLIEKLLLEAVEARKPVRLSVVKGLRAMHLYERLGFRKVGEDLLRQEMEWK